MSAFAFGVAQIHSVRERYVYVNCPFCRCMHAHMKSAIGSREVVAGCSKGPVAPRLYAIPARKRITP